VSEGNPLRLSFMRRFDMANDSHLFADRPGPGLLPRILDLTCTAGDLRPFANDRG
jgi:hypothetical protein